MNFMDLFVKNEDGITVIEYAIIGVAMSAAIFYIYNNGGFLDALKEIWSSISKNINGVRSITS